MRFYTLIEAPDGRVWASRNDGLFEWRKGSGVFRPELEHPAFLQPFLDIDVLPDSSLVFCPKGHGVIIWNMLNHYLNLEQLRFKEAFEYLISVDPFLDQAHTVLPPLIVQPFVENAVLHGMKGLKKDGLILIKFYPENGFLCVEVRDNGSGLRQDESKDAKGSLGGKITRRRLELLNDQSSKDEISIEYSTPESGIGTTVLIRLPLRQVPTEQRNS